MTTRTRIHPGDSDPRHGTTNGYRNLGCRCPLCRAAQNDDLATYLDAHPEQREAHRARQKRLAAGRRRQLPPIGPDDYPAPEPPIDIDTTDRVLDDYRDRD